MASRDVMNMSLSRFWELVIDKEAGMVQSMQRVRHDGLTELKYTKYHK